MERRCEAIGCVKNRIINHFLKLGPKSFFSPALFLQGGQFVRVGPRVVVVAGLKLGWTTHFQACPRGGRGEALAFQQRAVMRESRVPTSRVPRAQEASCTDGKTSVGRIPPSGGDFLVGFCHIYFSTSKAIAPDTQTAPYAGEAADSVAAPNVSLNICFVIPEYLGRGELENVTRVLFVTPRGFQILMSMEPSLRRILNARLCPKAFTFARDSEWSTQQLKARQPFLQCSLEAPVVFSSFAGFTWFEQFFVGTCVYQFKVFI